MVRKLSKKKYAEIKAILNRLQGSLNYTGTGVELLKELRKPGFNKAL
jgi:hypothetical protein